MGGKGSLWGHSRSQWASRSASRVLLAVLLAAGRPRPVTASWCRKADVFTAEGDFRAATIPSDCAWLDLADVGIGDTGAMAVAKALETNTVVTGVYLGHNSIGSAGAAALAKALEANTAVTKLVLHHNSIGDAGAAALARALETNIAITSLHLEGNGIGDGGATAVAKALETNEAITHLHMADNNIMKPGLEERIQALVKQNHLPEKHPELHGHSEF